MKKLIIFFVAVFAIVACGGSEASQDVKVVDGQFVLDGQPQYFIGTNMWYAGRLAASAEGMQRLEKELDYLKGIGVTNLRVLATEGEDLDALELALQQMEKRGMKAVLFLNNAWEWSYGFLDYLESATSQRQPRPSVDGYQAYMSAMAGFHTNSQAVALNQEYVKKVVERLKGSKAIFSWQISNEPRCFSSDPKNKDAFVNYILSTAWLIKSIDPDHLVSTGNEGFMGCEEDMDLVRRINNSREIDYITIHIWPYNWSWVKEDGISDGYDSAIEKIGEYIDSHLKIAAEMNKPVVVEEFGYPRDGFRFDKASSTVGRDAIYGYVFNRVVENQAKGGLLAGCNFWAWGGFADNAHEWWQEGDDYCGDPGQEQQGLNSVFVGDSTVDVISAATSALKNNNHIYVAMQHDWIFTGKEKTLYVDTYGDSRNDVTVNVALVADRSLMLQADTVCILSSSVKAGQRASFDLSAVEPGFYQTRVSYNGGELKSFNIGIDPEMIESPVDVDSEEFDAFWAKNLQELAAVPMDVTMEKDEAHSNEVRSSYRVKMKSLGGAEIGGLLCMPNAEGKYPVYLEYMGYGADVYDYNPDSNPERIQFLVSVRGQGIFREPQARWIDRGLDSKENFYYRGAYCDVVRAIDFVCSLPNADTDHVFALGESQGGAFTIVASALDNRIKAAAPAVPFMGDFCDYWKIVWWPVWEVFETAEKEGISREQVLDLLRWFDTKNFARRVNCPVKMGFGLQDPTCPPHTNFAAYNQFAGPKSYYTAAYCGHGIWAVPEWAAEREKFFDSLK